VPPTAERSIDQSLPWLRLERVQHLRQQDRYVDRSVNCTQPWVDRTEFPSGVRSDLGSQLGVSNEIKPLKLGGAD
jgi:hypothetical protein